MEATEANLDIKVTQLKMSIGKTNTIVETGKSEAIERHLSTLRSLSKELNRMRIEVEATKLGAKEEIADIEAWNSGIDAQLEEADCEVDKMCTWIDDRKREAEAIVKQEELKFHKAKIEMQAEIQVEPHPQQATTTPSDIQAKLPKLMITKFDGTYMDWPRFWGQFTEAVDKTGIQLITKFSYLRELLDVKVKRAIEALPFTAEGYNRAKSILSERFGKESEIVKAYIKEILDLPSISSPNPRKIGEFSEKLTYCVQALQTLNKLEQVNGAVSMTLDKLPAIRGDLVRTDPDWESWDFAKLSEAVRLWTRKQEFTTRVGAPMVNPAVGLTFTVAKITKPSNVQESHMSLIANKFSSTNVCVSTAPPETIAQPFVLLQTAYKKSKNTQRSSGDKSQPLTTQPILQAEGVWSLTQSSGGVVQHGYEILRAGLKTLLPKNHKLQKRRLKSSKKC